MSRPACPPTTSAETSRGDRSAYTSPTNIGGYLWSTVSGSRPRNHHATTRRVTEWPRRSRRSRTLERNDRERHVLQLVLADDRRASCTTMARPRATWCTRSSARSTTGWLAAALRIVREAEPRLAERADALYDAMDFAGVLRPRRRGPTAARARGGFWEAAPPDCSGRGADVQRLGRRPCSTRATTTTRRSARAASRPPRASPNGRVSRHGAARHAPHEAAGRRPGLAGGSCPTGRTRLAGR